MYHATTMTRRIKAPTLKAARCRMKPTLGRHELTPKDPEGIEGKRKDRKEWETGEKKGEQLEAIALRLEAIALRPCT